MGKIIPMIYPKFLLRPIQTVSLMKILECMYMAPTTNKTSLILDLISGKIGSALYTLKFVNLMVLGMLQMQELKFLEAGAEHFPKNHCQFLPGVIWVLVVLIIHFSQGQVLMNMKRLFYEILEMIGSRL